MIKLLQPKPAPKRLLVKKSVDDVIFSGTMIPEEVTTIAFTMPSGLHPIAKFFTDKAKKYAAEIMYEPGVMHNLSNIRRTSFNSCDKQRPPNPDFFFELDIPYPVGEYDYQGAGMTYAWTPIAYMLQHDRRSTSKAFVNAINGNNERILRSVWTNLLVKGFVLSFENDRDTLQKICQIMILTDPPADLLDTLMWDDDFKDINGVTRGELVESARDFQYRWNCGEWFSRGDRYTTRRALRSLLGVESET